MLYHEGKKQDSVFVRRVWKLGETGSNIKLHLMFRQRGCQTCRLPVSCPETRKFRKNLLSKKMAVYEKGYSLHENITY